ncbi:aldehyde dehydrogenase family protein [uncultured Mycobacterium sp.]|uniref:aldehyde dehydrogenase family protein n=1 Tax=uncultured Mycobacterium sp. TaxID=171292 RepID=UPI0035C9A260
MPHTVERSLAARHAETANRLLPKVNVVIGAEERPSGSGGVFEHVNPSIGRVQAQISLAGPQDVDDAVAAARRALTPWRAMKSSARRDVLLTFAQLVRDYADWVDLQVVENGMPSLYAAQFAGLAYDWCSYYAAWADKLVGEVAAHNDSDGFIYTLPEPYGVVAIIITWNAPLLSLAMKLPPALAAGNTVVLKPAELTPFTAMVWRDLARRAGIPDGVINIVPGGPEAGEALVKHPGVDKISFTGGPPTARAIMRGAADQLTPVLFELGGKGANLVFDDADLTEAVPFSCSFALANSGQGCALPTRLLVQRSVYDTVLDQLAAIAGSLKVGDPLEPDTYIGPLIHADALKRVVSVVDSAIGQRSGRLLVGGQRAGGELSDGYFMNPTIFADVDAGSDLAQREIFGPVLAVTPFDTEDEAVALANATPYGLTNYIQSKDSRRIERLIPQLNCGTVGVNTGVCNHHLAPFGGNGISGFGREGGKAGLDEFIRVKTVLQR